MSEKEAKTEKAPMTEKAKPAKEVVAKGVAEGEKLQAQGYILLRAYRETMHGPKLFVFAPKE